MTVEVIHKMMTKEKRSEYMREWRSRNRDKIRDQRREKSRSEALAALESVKRLDAHVFIMRTRDGREYLVGGQR